jgi:hypothetical protein
MERRHHAGFCLGLGATRADDGSSIREAAFTISYNRSARSDFRRTLPASSRSGSSTNSIVRGSL